MSCDTHVICTPGLPIVAIIVPVVLTFTLVLIVVIVLAYMIK